MVYLRPRNPLPKNDIKCLRQEAEDGFAIETTSGPVLRPVKGPPLGGRHQGEREVVRFGYGGLVFAAPPTPNNLSHSPSSLGEGKEPLKKEGGGVRVQDPHFKKRAQYVAWEI